MANIGRDADDMIASLMQEMSQQQGYGETRKEKSSLGSMSPSQQQFALNHRQIQELSNYPDNTFKAGSRSIWNPLVSGKCGSSRFIAKDRKYTGVSLSSFLLPTNPRVEVIRRRVFEKFRQEVQTLLHEFQTKHLSFVSSSNPRGSGSFSKNKSKLPIPSMIDKWYMDAKLEEKNLLLTKGNTSPNSHEDTRFRSDSFSSIADVLRERSWRHQLGKIIYDPILLGKEAPSVFVETILTPQVQKMWEQSGRPTNDNSPMPPTFGKKAKQLQRALYRLICEAIDSFETQLLQGAREESMRSTRITKKNSKGSHDGNKRPKIVYFNGGDSDDFTSTSIVKVTFSGVTLKIHRAYLEKLQRLYDRAKERLQKEDSSYGLDLYHHLGFEEALFCLLCRYDMIQGAGLQAGVPGAIMDVLLERFDCRMECFASPLNCRYDRFASAFPDVDTSFGSAGSFFELPFLSDCDEIEKSGVENNGDGSTKGDDDSPSGSSIVKGEGICYEANPPFCDGLILQLDEKITKILSSSTERNQTPIMFVVFVPAWRDSECYQALLANRCLTKHLVLKQGEHWYAEGTQHRRKDSFRVASFDTSILFYQNKSAQKLWKLQGDEDESNKTNPVFRELQAAFSQDPGTMQKEQVPLGKPLDKAEKKCLNTHGSVVRAGETGADDQSFPAKDRTKESPATQPTKKTVATKKSKNGTQRKKRHWNQKEERTAQLGLLASLGLSSPTSAVQDTLSDTPKANKSSKTARKKKKRRKN